MEKGSLGLIETWGYVPAIEAADAGSKAANVTLLGYEEVRAGLVTVKFVGDVAAVRAAVTAGAAAAGKVGKVVSVHVIPRPDRQLRIAPGSPPTPGEKQPEPPPPSPPGEEGAEPAPAVPAPLEGEQPEPPPIPSAPAEGPEPEDELPPEPAITPVKKKEKARGGKIKKKH
jgi:hypothetical protein